MADVDIDYLRSWIGRERNVEDIITPRLAASLDAVLDTGREHKDGTPAPVGIHWCLAPDMVPMREIGPDGHPARGGFLPPVPFPRRMWAGGQLDFSDELQVGDRVLRHSVIDNVEAKSGRSGEMIFVTVRHRYSTSRGPAIEERQDIVYRKLDAAGGGQGTAPASDDRPADHTRHVDASPVLLFRYSAITFNGHRIHYDQPYVTGEEGYPGLVFHGPLQATLLLRLATELRNGDVPRRFRFRSVRPLFAGGRISMHARADSGTQDLWIADQQGIATMRATA